MSFDLHMTKQEKCVFYISVNTVKYVWVMCCSNKLSVRHSGVEEQTRSLSALSSGMAWCEALCGKLPALQLRGEPIVMAHASTKDGKWDSVLLTQYGMTFTVMTVVYRGDLSDRFVNAADEDPFFCSSRDEEGGMTCRSHLWWFYFFLLLLLPFFSI